MDTISYAWGDVKAMLASEVAMPLAEGLRSVLDYVRNNGGLGARGDPVDRLSGSLSADHGDRWGEPPDRVTSQELFTILATIKGAMAGASIGTAIWADRHDRPVAWSGESRAWRAEDMSGGKVETNLEPLRQAASEFTKCRSNGAAGRLEEDRRRCCQLSAGGVGPGADSGQ